MPGTKPSLMGFGAGFSDMRRLERSERGPRCQGTVAPPTNHSSHRQGRPLGPEPPLSVAGRRPGPTVVERLQKARDEHRV